MHDHYGEMHRNYWKLSNNTLVDGDIYDSHG